MSSQFAKGVAIERENDYTEGVTTTSTRFLRTELDELREGQAEVVRGEVRQLVALVNLAEHYRVDEDELLEVLVDSLPFGGCEGTPPVSEFLSLEIGAALGIPATTAGGRVHAALDLKYRHPHLWNEVLEGRVRVWQAERVTQRVSSSGLGLAEVSDVDEAFVRLTRGLPFTRAMKVLDGLIASASPELAAVRAAKAADRRGVWFGQHADGVVDVWATLSSVDMVALKATTYQLAEVLAWAGDTEHADARHAKALGLLANPARALQLMQARILDAEACGQRESTGVSSTEPSPEGTSVCDEATSDPSHRFCGTVTVDPAKLLPKTTLIVHLSDTVLTDDDGVVRVEGVGPITVDTMRRFLGNTRVTVRPVIDLNTIGAVDHYEIPRSIRHALALQHPYERFPYSTVRESRCDLDHILAWQPARGPGQTSPANLTPLSRRVHRAKTAGHWILHQKDPTSYMWESPLGYRYEEGPNGTRRLAPKFTDQRGIDSAEEHHAVGLTGFEPATP